MEEPEKFYNVEEDCLERKLLEQSRFMELLELRGNVHAGISTVETFLFMPEGTSPEVSRFSHFEVKTTKEIPHGLQTTVDKITTQEICLDPDANRNLTIFMNMLSKVKKELLKTQECIRYLTAHPPDFHDGKTHNVFFQWIHNLVVMKQLNAMNKKLRNNSATLETLLQRVTHLDHVAQMNVHGFPLGIKPFFDQISAMDELRSMRITIELMKATLDPYLA